jgi:hypothetical protein
MAETLGSLCDKLTIVKLKQFHCDSEAKAESLTRQAVQLAGEVDAFVADAAAGCIPPERLSFASNKVYKREGNDLSPVPEGSVGEAFAELAKVNCDLWHEQEKVYAFEQVPADEKDKVVKLLALLNLRRNQCIDAIDKALIQQIKGQRQWSKS